MEFLKTILGDELYGQIESKVNEHNGNEANKDKQIKLANLGSGGYVSKEDFDGISSDLSSRTAELEKANGLIEELKKAGKGNEEMQGKITEYKNQIEAMQKEVAEMKVKTAVEIALHKANAADVDYLTYKLNEKLSGEGKTLELDDNGNVKGLSDRITELKTAYPKMFDSAGSDGYVLVNGDENKLPTGDNRGAEPQNLADALRMQSELN